MFPLKNTVFFAKLLHNHDNIFPSIFFKRQVVSGHIPPQDVEVTWQKR